MSTNPLLLGPWRMMGANAIVQDTGHRPVVLAATAPPWSVGPYLSVRDERGVLVPATSEAPVFRALLGLPQFIDLAQRLALRPTASEADNLSQRARELLAMYGVA